MIFLGTASYFIRDWRILQLVLTIPSIVSFTLAYWVTESPSWCYATGQPQLALKQCSLIARRNGDTVDVDSYASLSNHQQDQQPQLQSVIEHCNIMTILTNRVLRKHLLVMILIFFGGN